MIQKIFEIRAIQIFCAADIVLLTLSMIFTPQAMVFMVLSNYAVHFMFLLMLSSIFFLILNNRPLLFISLICCGMLAWHLRRSANQEIQYAPMTDKPSICVIQLNTSNIPEDPSIIRDIILNENADLVTIQEMTPYWASIMDTILLDSFPHKASMVRIDPYGMKFYSKKKILGSDTLFIDGLPVFVAKVLISRLDTVSLYGLYPVSIDNIASFSKLGKQLTKVATHIIESPNPGIIAGDFNVVPWNAEIQKFKYLTGFSDCRREYIPANISDFTIEKLPMEHIFCSDHFNCRGFKTINLENGTYLGVKAEFQLN